MKREVKNQMRLILPAVSENESLARAAVSLFFARLDPDTEALADVRCAVSEAVTNCIVHAYRGGSGMIYINAKLYSDQSMTVEIKDKGCGIEDIEKALLPLYTTDKAGERSGMGFPIMKSFMDRVRVKSRIGVGTTVFMEKRVERAAD